MSGWRGTAGDSPPAEWRRLLSDLRGRLGLERALTFLDLESTGLDTRRHRIVEICLLRLDPTAAPGWLSTPVDPGRSIPPEATAVHGIADEDVAGAPAFADLAGRVVELLRGADLAGYNLSRFDLPLLERELRRCGRVAPWDDAAVVDVWAIFTHHERRDLSAAHRFYGAGELTDAHGAAADVRATMEVLTRQLDRYPELPRDPRQLALLNRWRRRTAPAAWIRRDADAPELGFGRYRGRSLRRVAREDPDYLRAWLDSGLPSSLRRELAAALGSGSETGG